MGVCEMSKGQSERLATSRWALGTSWGWEWGGVIVTEVLFSAFQTLLNRSEVSCVVAQTVKNPPAMQETQV